MTNISWCDGKFAPQLLQIPQSAKFENKLSLSTWARLFKRRLTLTLD